MVQNKIMKASTDIRMDLHSVNHQSDGSKEMNSRMYTCNECNKTFRRKSLLGAHMHVHTGEKIFSCGICDKKFTTKNNLKNHLYIHTGEKPFSCDQCHMRFIPLSSLKRHECKHRGEKWCLKCQKSFMSSDEYKEHMKRKHSDAKKHVCEICKKQFSAIAKLTEHARVHTGEKPFSCNECGKAFTQMVHLEIHERQHTGEKSYKCNKCEKSFRHNSTLKGHMETHEKKDNRKKFSCAECGKQLSSKINLAHHTRIHTGEKPFACMECNLSFTQKVNLEKHIESVHVVARPYMCTDCNRGFKRFAHLESHLLTHQSLREWVPCLECSQTFTTKGGLRVHMLIHSGEKPFKCRECDRSFRTSGHLKRHERTHTGEKPYVCIHCSEGFTQLGSMQNHISTQHEKLIKCRDCTLKFSKFEMRIHRRIHAGEEIYNCDSCGEVFARLKSLRAHKINHCSKEKSSACAQGSGDFENKTCIVIEKKSNGENKCDVKLRWMQTSNISRANVRGSSFAYTDCNDQFPRAANLRRHMRTHDSSKENESDEMKDISDSKDTPSAPGDLKLFGCGICCEYFASREEAIACFNEHKSIESKKV